MDPFSHKIQNLRKILLLIILFKKFNKTNSNLYAKLNFVFITCKQEKLYDNISKFLISKEILKISNNSAKNLIHTLFHWENYFKQKDNKDYYGYLDEEIIKLLHKSLMQNLINLNHNTAPGIFSKHIRSSEYQKQIHIYPNFSSDIEWMLKLQPILDTFNSCVYKIKKLKFGKEKLEKVIQLASWIFLQIITLHPFSDGNGRLCKFLLSYVLQLIIPIPIPLDGFLTNTNSSIINAIIKWRKTKSQISLQNLVEKSLAFFLQKSIIYCLRK